MTHEAERAIGDEVVEWFEDQYGEDNVHREYYIADTGCFCDILVETGWCSLYVELENDKESIREGMGQAMEYAGNDKVTGVPMVITPEGHVNEERIRHLRNNGVLVREFDGDMMEFVG